MIVGLTGPAGVGKSAVAAELVAHGWRRIRFAGPLKAMLGVLLAAQGMPETEIARRLEGDLKEAPEPLLAGATPRWAMQSLGTEWGRSCLGAGLWVAAWERAAAAARAQGVPVVADDLRFPNEADAVGRLSGWVVELRRPGFGWSAVHESEAGRVTPDCVIDNTTPAEAARQIRASLH